MGSLKCFSFVGAFWRQSVKMDLKNLDQYLEASPILFCRVVTRSGKQRPFLFRENMYFLLGKKTEKVSRKKNEHLTQAGNGKPSRDSFCIALCIARQLVGPFLGRAAESRRSVLAKKVHEDVLYTNCILDHPAESSLCQFCCYLLGVLVWKMAKESSGKVGENPWKNFRSRDKSGNSCAANWMSWCFSAQLCQEARVVLHVRLTHFLSFSYSVG